MAEITPTSVVLHVGTHKTGSSSLQQLLRDQDAGLLATAGVSYPPGYLLPTLHADLPLLVMRPERMWPARIRFPETQRAGWQAAAEAHVRRQVRATPRRTLLYSHEDLSYVRHDDELHRLRDLFAGVEVNIVVILRDRAAFLRSYREQMEATGFPASDDPTSFAYVEPDSWLVDYEALVGAYRRGFGEENVEVLDYDAIVGRDGSVIPAFAERLGIERTALPPLEPYFLNRSGMHLRPTPEQLADIRRRLAEHEP